MLSMPVDSFESSDSEPRQHLGEVPRVGSSELASTPPSHQVGQYYLSENPTLDLSFIGFPT